MPLSAVSVARGFDGALALANDPSWTKIPRSTHRSALGVGGTAILSGKIRYEEWNRALENEKGYGEWSRHGVYDEMRRTDPQVRRALWLLKLPILSADWAVEPGDDDDESAEIADFVSSNLFEDLNWLDTIRQALGFYEYGFMLFEILDDSIEVARDRFPSLPGGRSSGRPPKGATTEAIRWTAFEPRLPKTIYQWVPRKDRPCYVSEVVQWIGGDDTGGARHVRISGERLLRFTHEQEAGNFQGVSILRPLYKPWKIKDQLERLDAIRHERQNVGIPVITLPPDTNDDDIDKAEKILSALASHEKGYLVLENGWQFKWDTSGQGQGTDVGARIEQLNRDIADGVLAGFMALGNGDTGSYALAETQADRHLDLITVGARQVEGVFNFGSEGISPIRRLVDLNYGRQAKYPTLRAKNLRSRDDWAQILPLVNQLLQSGALRTSRRLEEAILRRLNLPEAILPEDEEQDPIEVKTAPEEDSEKEATPETGKSEEKADGEA